MIDTTHPLVLREGTRKGGGRRGKLSLDLIGINFVDRIEGRQEVSAVFPVGQYWRRRFLIRWHV